LLIDGVPAEYHKIELRKNQKKIAIWMDQDKHTRLKTEKTEESDIFLAKLNLNHLGLTDKTLLFFGCLSTVYVSAPCWSDVASQVSTVH
jgi:hypothetical protein